MSDCSGSGRKGSHLVAELAGKEMERLTERRY